MAKYVKHLSNNELLERMADDLVEAHNGTYIDLATWETAREIVERFYEVDVIVAIGDKKGAK